MNIYLEKLKGKSKQELEKMLRNESQYNTEEIQATRELLSEDGHQTTKPTAPKNSVFTFSTESNTIPQMKYFGYVGILAGLITIPNNWIVGVTIALISIIVMLYFRRSKLILDLDKNTVTPNSFFGSESEHFNKIERLDIKSIHVSQRLNSRGSTTVIRYELFQAFLVSDGTRILLGEERTKKPLIEQLNRISAMTNSPINDET